MHKFPVRHRAALPHWRRREQKSPRGRPDGCRGGLGLHAAKWRANVSLPPRLKAKGRHKAAPHGTRRRAVPCCTFLYAAHCPVSIVRKLGTVTRLGARRQNGAKAALPGQARHGGGTARDLHPLPRIRPAAREFCFPAKAYHRKRRKASGLARLRLYFGAQCGILRRKEATKERCAMQRQDAVNWYKNITKSLFTCSTPSR